MKKNIEATIVILTCILFFSGVTEAFSQRSGLPENFHYESGAILDIEDPVGDDKGPGYYRYPLDSRFKRGTFDIKRFTVYREDPMIVFEIQMRNYIMRQWPDTRQTEYQGFVANLWDIYIDIDGAEFSGYDMALPGRDVQFRDNMGWEKVVMVTPLSERVVYDILKSRTDDIEFQNIIDDILIPDYITVRRDRVIVKVDSARLPGLSESSGFQLFSMGFENIVSFNRLLNRDVRAFPTRQDFGGGSDMRGNPTVIDMIVPDGECQYEILSDYRPAAFRNNITYAQVPFVYAGGRNTPSVIPRRRNQDPLLTNSPVRLPSTEPVKKPPQINISPDLPEGFVPINSNN